MENEDTAKVPVDPVDDDLHRKEVVMATFDWQQYNREEVRLPIFQVDEVVSMLRAVSQIHEIESMKFIKLNKRQYGVGLMTVANPISGRIGAVKVDNMLQQPEKGLVPQKSSCSRYC